MLNKYQFLKKLANTKFLSLSPQKFSLPPQTMNLFKSYFFSTSHIRDDIDCLQHLSFEQKEKMSKIMLSKQDSLQLTSDELKWMLSGVWDLSRTHFQKGDDARSYEYLTKTDEIFQKLGIKDTIDVALNCYKKSSILISQYRLEEAEKFLNEVDRICKLLCKDPKAKSLRVQSWCLLARCSSDDKALELYHAVLKNIGDVSESELPSILTSVHRDMGRIYLSRDDIDNMVMSWENGLQAAIKYFGENSTLAFDFYCDIVDNLATRDQNERAEPYAENCVQVALEAFPNPHLNIAKSYALLGNIYLDNEKYAQAVNSYNEAFKVFEKLPQDYSYILYDVYFLTLCTFRGPSRKHYVKVHISYIYKGSMAIAQGSLGHHQEASNFLSKADQTFFKINAQTNSSAAFWIYSRWASDLKDFEMFTASQEYYQKALDLYQTLDVPNEVMIFSIYSGLGDIAYAEENWDKALELWKEAEKYIDQIDDLSVQKFYINLDSFYSNLENHEESEKCVQKLLKSCEIAEDISYAFAAYYESGEDYEKEGKLEEALPCYEVAARVYEKDENKDPEKAQNLAAKISQIKAKLQMTK